MNYMDEIEAKHKGDRWSAYEEACEMVDRLRLDLAAAKRDALVWFPVSDMLPLCKREGADNNWVLGAWVREGKTFCIRTVMCDPEGVFWLTPDIKAKTVPQYFCDLPKGPTVAMSAGEAKDKP